MATLLPQEIQLPHVEGNTGRMHSIPNVPKDYGARIAKKAEGLGYVPVVLKTDRKGNPIVIDIFEKDKDGRKKEQPFFRGAYVNDGFAYHIEVNDNQHGSLKVLRDIYGVMDSEAGVKHGKM